MYQLYKLTPVNQDFLKSLTVDSKLVAFALAKVISDNFAIPSTALENNSEDFKNTLAESAKEQLGAINEIVVIDIDLVIEKALKFYDVRYATVYPGEKLYMPTEEATLANFFGYDNKIPKDDLNYVTVNCIELLKLINGFKAVVRELNSIEGE